MFKTNFVRGAVIICSFICCAHGLDLQPPPNVWQTATNSRPWQTREWQATANTSPQRSTAHGQTDMPSQDKDPIKFRDTSTLPPNQPSHRRRDGQQSRPYQRDQRRPASPQNNTKVTDSELSILSENLFDDDLSNTGRYIAIDPQARTQSNSLTDVAPNPLLTVQEEALSSPTVQSLRKLYDNYIAEASFVESVTSEESHEESVFLDRVLDTAVMKRAMEFLANKGYVQKNKKAYKDMLHLLWFTMYSRGGRIIGSSGFEHVFLGELKKDEVSGLHNWVYFANEEKNQTVNYMGFLRKIEFGKNTTCLKIHYRWRNILKPSGTLFIGTSPELEMALYTVCFLTRPDERCPVTLGGKSFGIQTYTYRQRGKIVVGSAYPTF